MRDYADHYGRICDAVNVPVYVDADTGFGGVHNVRKTVRAFERAGVAGLFISDQVFPNRCGYMPGKSVIPAEEILAKLKSALDARTDPDFFIAGRTDVLPIEGFDAAVERCQMFMELGADMAMPHGADTVPQIRDAMKAIPGPHMAILSHAAGKPKVGLKDLDDCGVTTAIFPSAALFAAVGGVARAMQALKKDGNFDAVDKELVPLEDYYDLVGLKFYNDYERECVEEGLRIAGKKSAAAE